MTSTAPASAPPRDLSPVPLSVVAMVVPDPDPDPAAPGTGTGTGTDPTATDPAATGAGVPGRLPSGELRRRVAGYLAGHPGVDFTPGQIARALSGRSSGAVANALVVLAGLGAAEQTGDRPTRFRATPGSATIAAAPPVIVTGLAPSPTPSPTATPAGRVRSGRAPVTPTGPGTVARIGLAAAGGAEPVVDPVTGAVLRPNGQAYHPRQLADGSDVDALRKLRAAGVSVLLYGPPGTGKTSVIEAAFPDLLTVAGDGDTTVADLVGEYTQTPEGRYVFVHGPLVRAMREGRALLLDDATLIPPSVLAVAYPAMDGRREIVVKANGGEIVTAQPGFYVIAGHNPGVHGAVLTDALSSRFALQVQVSTDYDLAKQLKIDRRAVRVAKNLATRAERGEIGWAPQLRELIAFQRVVTVLGVEAATANLVGIAPEEDRDTVATVVRTVFGTAVTPLALGPQVTPPIPTDPTTPATPAAGSETGDPDPAAPTGTEGQDDPR